MKIRQIVTPCAGVWIEILVYWKQSYLPPSLPVRECGLKYLVGNVACALGQSLPVRECGLKYQNCRMYENIQLSLPVRECGLKYKDI